MLSSADSVGLAEHRFSTSALPTEQRLAFWRDAFASKAIHLDIRVPEGDRFQGNGLIQAMPGLRVTSFRTTAAQLRRTPATITDGDDAVALVVPARGRLNAVQCGREATIEPGEALLLLNNEPGALTHGNVRFDTFLVPRAPLAAACSNVEDAAARRIPRRNGLLQLLRSYVKAAATHLSAFEHQSARGLVASHVQDLVAAIAASHCDGAEQVGEEGVRAARLAAVKSDVIAHIGREGFTLASVAARHEITPRSLQRLFEADWSTFSAFKLEQQLLFVRRMLASKAHPFPMVSAIAYAAGFSDLSYFNRSFRNRFGVTPSEFRGSISEPR